MRRRTYLATTAAGMIAGFAGCAGGEVLHSVQRSLTVPKGRGWIEKLPADADRLRFTARGEQPFDVYVFTDPADAKVYRTYTDGGSPGRSPAGNTDLGGRATRVDGDVYQVATADRAREALPGDGPAFFVVDHSDYSSGTVPGEQVGDLSVTVDLAAVRSTLSL